MKIDLTDMTFLIPIRIDSVVRLENLMLSVESITSNFNCNIFVLEADRYNRHFIDTLCRNIRYEFVEDKDTVFHRTKYINRMALKSNSPYLAIWDADIIIPPKQILDSIYNMRSGKCQIAYPYNGRCMETSDILRSRYIENRDVNYLTLNVDNMQLLKNYKENVGGAIFVNREAYIASGMENEQFYGWGAEDNERYARWKNLGYAIYRSEGVLFHLTHPRGENSNYTSNYHQKKALAEFQKTTIEVKGEILHNVETNYYKTVHYD